MVSNAGSNMKVGQPILVGRVDLSQFPPTTAFANRGPVSPLNNGPVNEVRTEVGKLFPSNLPKDGSFGKTIEVSIGDAELIDDSEAILIGEVELSDVMSVTEVLTGNGDSASPVSSGPVVEGRTEVDKLDANNLPTDGSFGKTTEVASSKVQKKSVVSTAPWNGESVQRKRTSGSLRNQLFDSALSELFQL